MYVGSPFPVTWHCLPLTPFYVFSLSPVIETGPTVTVVAVRFPSAELLFRPFSSADIRFATVVSNWHAETGHPLVPPQLDPSRATPGTDDDRCFSDRNTGH
jgi:hypothetical protein